MMNNNAVIEELSARVAAGERLTDEELARVERANVLALGMLAETARRRVGRDVTYTRVHTIAGSPGEPLTVPATVSEVRLLTLPGSRDEAIALVRRVREAAGPGRRVAVFSLADLVERAAEGWGELGALARMLADAGANDVAELPADRLEALGEVVRTVRTGGLSASRVTVEAPLGARRLAVIREVRALQTTLGGIVRFAPLARRPPIDVPSTGYDDLRTIALVRLAFGDLAGTPEAISIEVDWTLYGPKLAQVALLFGADHLDAVPGESDPALGARRDVVRDVERNVRAAGFEPHEVSGLPA